MEKSKTMEDAELVQANLEVVTTLVSVLEDYIIRYMKSSAYVNEAGKYVADEIEILLGIAGTYLGEMKKTQDDLVDLLAWK